MARTFIRQDIQIRNSDLYDDTLPAGVALETGAANIQDDLNGDRSQIARILSAAGGNWWDDLASFANIDGETKRRGIAELNAQLDALEVKRFLCRITQPAAITVPATQNYVILSVAGTEAPSAVAATGATSRGAVVALAATSGAGFAAHELVEIAGPNGIQPENLIAIRDAGTFNAISSGGRDVFGLLQLESTGSDGAAFDDVVSGNRVKISFVRQNAAGNDLEAVPVADIENASIQYSYAQRERFVDIPADCFSSLGFVDNSGAVDVTLDNAIDNQSGPATQVQDINVDIADTFDWCFRDVNQAELLCVRSNAAGSTSTVEVGVDTDVYNNNAQDVNFTQGATFDGGGTPISVGDANAGVIETTGATDDLTVKAGQELFFDDVNQDGSTWAQTGGIKLSESTAEWDAFEATYGEVSLLAAINQAGQGVTVVQQWATVTANTPPDTDVGGVGGGTNLSAQLPDLSQGNFLTDYQVFVNGTAKEPGANAAANNDYYPGTSLANGQLRFEFQLRGGGNPDKILVVAFA